jgi:perosamine synthetase
LDPEQIEAAITSKTKAIIPVHYAGQPCEMDQILEITKEYKLKVIEDAAHALPAKYQGQNVGTMGDITCFSFYATKPITTGEGGMVTTDNDEYAERIGIMSLHGISKDAWKRYSSEGSWYYEILYPGYKYNLTDIAAAIGVEQLKKCDQFWHARKRIADMYNIGFAEIPEIRTPKCGSCMQHSWHLYVIQLDLERLRINRSEFIEALKNEGVGTSVHFIPLHLHPFYRDTFGYKPSDFPVASALSERIISLPIYPRMTAANVDAVISAVKKVARENRR